MPEGKRVGQTAPSLPRLLVVLVLALAASFQIVRTAVASHYLAARPELAVSVWPSNPRVALAGAMGEIGRSAAAGQAASPASVARAMDAARRGPLLTGPFLIGGAVALSKGDSTAAEALFREARRRDPRSAAARYFLAQHYLASGRPAEGLAEAAVLTRLVTGSSGAFVPALVQYAKEPGAVPKLRRMFVTRPDLGAMVLNELSRDPANAGLVFALAGEQGRADEGSAPEWQSTLVQSLIARGDYARAHGLWQRFNSVRGTEPGLFNPGFAKVAAPPPFNWTFGSGAFGVAEPLPPGQLQVIYYGRDEAQFASQLLMLQPGAHELRMVVRRDPAEGEDSQLHWTLTCQPGARRLLDLPLAKADTADGVLAGRFTVPANCPAQLLVLEATPRDVGRSEQVTISHLQLGPGAR